MAVRGVLLDLDGVLYVGDDPVPGAVDVVDWLVDEGIGHRFLTNTTSRPRQAVVDRLVGMGFAVRSDQVLTPAVAAVSWLHERGTGRPALFVPEATAAELAALDPLPADDPGPAGAVVLGDLGDGWDFATLNRAFRLLTENPAAALLALGMTRYWRAPDGLRLDTGPFVRALEYATGRDAVVLGKPDATFYGTAVASLGLEPHQVVMVGDDVRVDVEGAQHAGLAGLLVRTGKFSPADLAGDITPDAVLDSVADLPRWWAGT